MAILRGLLILFAIVCAGLGGRHVWHEWRLAEGRPATAEVVRLHLESQPEVSARRARSSNMDADPYATVRYSDHQQRTHEVKVFLPGQMYDTLEPGDTLDIVYAADRPDLARSVVQQQARTPAQIYANVYFVMAAMSVLAYILVGTGGVISK